MFGSGDDKKAKQAAPSANSESPEVSPQESQDAAVPETPAKKGLFSWFGRKKTEPKTEPSSAAEMPSPEETGQPAVEAVDTSGLSVEPEKQTAAVASDPVTAAGATSEAQQTFVEPAVEAATESTETIELETIAQQPVQHKIGRAHV